MNATDGNGPEAARTGRGRRRRAAGAVAAALGIATLGALAWGNLVPQGEGVPSNHLRAEEPASEASIDAPPAGMRWAGLGRVAVAVPEQWGHNETHCGVPQRDTVVVWDGATHLCLPPRPAGVDSITLTESPRTHSLPEQSTPTKVEVDGATALRWATRCSAGGRGEDPVCTGRVELPEHGVTVFADSNRGAEAVERLLAGLHVLEAGVGVPDHASWASELQERSTDEFARHLRERGFSVEVTTEQRWGVSPGYLLDTSPVPGTVVPSGSKVTLTAVAERGGPEDDISVNINTDAADAPEIGQEELRSGDLVVRLEVGDGVWAYAEGRGAEALAGEVTGGALVVDDWVEGPNHPHSWVAARPGRSTVTLSTTMDDQHVELATFVVVVS